MRETSVPRLAEENATISQTCSASQLIALMQEKCLAQPNRRVIDHSTGGNPPGRHVFGRAIQSGFGQKALSDRSLWKIAHFMHQLYDRATCTRFDERLSMPNSGAH